VQIPNFVSECKSKPKRDFENDFLSSVQVVCLACKPCLLRILDLFLVLVPYVLLAVVNIVMCICLVKEFSMDF
jgi:hypothetical protein